MERLYDYLVHVIAVRTGQRVANAFIEAVPHTEFYSFVLIA